MLTYIVHDSTGMLGQKWNDGLFPRWSFSSILNFFIFLNGFIEHCIVNFDDPFIGKDRKCIS